MSGIHENAGAPKIASPSKAAVAKSSPPEPKLPADPKAALQADHAAIKAQPTPGRTNAELLAAVMRVREDVDAKLGPSEPPRYARLDEAEQAFAKGDERAFMGLLTGDALKMGGSAEVLALSRYAFDKAVASGMWDRGDYLETARTLLMIGLSKAKTVSEADDVRSMAMRMSNSIPFPHRNLSHGVAMLDVAEIAARKSHELP